MNTRPKFFQNCPVCNADTPPGSINCPSCGVDLEIARGNQLSAPKLWSDFSYLAFGFITNIVISLSLAVLMYWYLELGFLLYLLYGIFLAAMSAIGRYGRVSFYGYINLMILSMIPIVNWAVVYYFGRGMHLSFTKQELADPPIATSFWAKVLVIGLVVAYIVFLVDTSTTTSAPIPTALPRAAVPPVATRTPRPKTPTPIPPDCLLWSQVAPQMEGRQVCVYGTVYDYRENWDDYLSYLYFGRRDQFFLVSVFRWNDSPEGQCIKAKGVVELNTYKVPYIKIEEFFYCDPSPNI